MQNTYVSSGKGVNTVCGKPDDDVDDYENVIDNRKVPAVPERARKGNRTTGKREDLQLRFMDKPANRKPDNRTENTTRGSRTVLPFQPPSIGLDFSSSAVNAAFSNQTVEQASERKQKCDWKKTVLIFCLVLILLFWILLTSIMFVYYSNISNQLAELQINVSRIQDLSKKERKAWKEDLMKVNQTLDSNISNQLAELQINVSRIQDLSKKEREAWKEDLMKVNQTLGNEIAVLKSGVQSIKGVLGLCTSCPAGWNLLASSCYFLSTSHQSWDNSRKDCSKMDSSLLILKSKKELDALRSLIGNKRFWIGLRRYYKDDWRWVDGTTTEYKNWNVGEPNNAGQHEHCTEMITGGWNDLDCSNTIDYICRKPTTC